MNGECHKVFSSLFALNRSPYITCSLSHIANVAALGHGNKMSLKGTTSFFSSGIVKLNNKHGKSSLKLLNPQNYSHT